jgi:SAM-dependent methyltransferase
VSDAKRLFYDSIAGELSDWNNTYDLQRRLEILAAALWSVEGQLAVALDAGCGNGQFSAVAKRRSKRVVSLDISAQLVARAARNADTFGVVGDALALPFNAATFDVVLSSEMVEHTLRPQSAVEELVRVLRPGGTLVLTTPNRRWQWLVRLASAVGVRPFHGFENFLSFEELRDLAANAGLANVRHLGFHAWPFQIAPLRSVSHLVDDLFGSTAWGAWMINQALVARKAQPN